MSQNNAPQISINDHVAEIQFGDGAKRNALTRSFWTELPELFDKINESPEVRAVVLRSEGKHFSSGIDLDYLRALFPRGNSDPARAREKLRRNILKLQSALTAVEGCRVPVMAVVQGGCIGGGIDLVAACDIIYASEDAFFSIQETNIGLAADLGSLQRLPRRLPYGLLRELAFTGRPLAAREALECGFVTALKEDHEAAIAHAREIAEAIASKSPMAILGTKQAFRIGADDLIERGLDYIATWNAGLMSEQDLAAGIEAALKKKKATFPELAE